MTTRFILISPARSGSTMVRMTLAKHPQILMHGEVMGRRQTRTQLWGYLPETQKVLGREAFEKALLLERARDTRRFVNERIFIAGPNQKNTVGFKIILEQAFSLYFADTFLWLAEQKDVRIIWLKRRNHLARYASGLLALEGRVLVNLNDEVPTQLTTEVDPEQFQQDMRNQESAMKILREHFIDHPSLDVFYEDIMQDTYSGYKRIFSFLNVDDSVEPIMATKKINSTNLNEVISNFEAIRSHAAISPFLK